MIVSRIRMMWSLVFACVMAACTRTAQSASAPVDVAAEVRTAEEAWIRGLQRSDTAALGRLLGAEYVLAGLDASRPPLPRAMWLQNLASGRVATDTAFLRDIVVTPVSRDSAVAVLWMHWKPVIGGQRMPIDVTRIEDSWARRDGLWQATRRHVLERVPPR